MIHQKNIKKVGFERIHPFKQKIFYKNKIEILVSKFDQKFLIEAHKHSSMQFGFCFKGAFNFNIKGEEYQIKKNNAYCINNNIMHGAKIEADTYTLDIKIETSSNTEVFNNFNKVSLDQFKIERLESKKFIHTYSDIYYLIVAERGQITLDKQEILLEPYEIYEVNSNQNLSFNYRQKSPIIGLRIQKEQYEQHKKRNFS